MLTLHKSDLVNTEGLLASLKGMSDSRWAEESLSGRRLADLLKPYGITPTRTSTVRGYKRAQFDDAFERYLTPAVA